MKILSLTSSRHLPGRLSRQCNSSSIKGLGLWSCKRRNQFVSTSCTSIGGDPYWTSGDNRCRCYCHTSKSPLRQKQQQESSPSPDLSPSLSSYLQSRLESLQAVLRNIVHGDDDVNPKKLLERQYLYYALLATKYRSLRMEQQQQLQQGAEQGQNDNNAQHVLESTPTGMNTRTTSTTTTMSSTLNEELYERATLELDQENLDRMRNIHLRRKLQDALHDQVLDIFQALHRVDADQLSLLPDKKNRQPMNERQFHESSLESMDWGLCESILLREHDQVLSELAEHYSNNHTTTDEKMQRSVAFWKRKLGAIETLLEFHGWTPKSTSSSLSLPELDSKDDSDPFDDFYLDVSDTGGKRLRLIRQYQTVNLCRSALIRQEMGFSIVCFKSLIPGAGRGVFLDGHALAGSLVAFQPGDIWPKEHLLTSAGEVMEHFEGEDDCHISLRFDDYVVDSREAPVTVLSRPGSMNPLALGHMVNHPPVGTLPNCQSTMLNYTDRMKLGHLGRYVPNSYAHAPSWQGRVFDPEPIIMHGLSLLARRDLFNEELVYDYRLQSGDTPDWYSVVKYGNHMDNDEQVVFFRDDWKKSK